jgi:hypothetical protein
MEQFSGNAYFIFNDKQKKGEKSPQEGQVACTAAGRLRSYNK